MSTVQTTPPPQKVTVTDIDMPFGSMVVFMLKWALAAIPATLILMFVGGVAFVVLGGFAQGLMLAGGGAAARSESASTYTAPQPTDSRAALDRDRADWQQECANRANDQDCGLRKVVLDMRERALAR